MSRHRDVRGMDLTGKSERANSPISRLYFGFLINSEFFHAEYDDYDVFGHSVEDDYCISPGGECLFLR